MMFPRQSTNFETFWIFVMFPAPGLEPIGDFALEVVTVLMSIKFFQLMKFDLTRSSSWLILPSHLPDVAIKLSRVQKSK